MSANTDSLSSWTLEEASHSFCPLVAMETVIRGHASCQMSAGNPLSCVSSEKYLVCCVTFDFVGHFKTRHQSLVGSCLGIRYSSRSESIFLIFLINWCTSIHFYTNFNILINVCYRHAVESTTKCKNKEELGSFWCLNYWNKPFRWVYSSSAFTTLGD